jgi:hypothetical protein
MTSSRARKALLVALVAVPMLFSSNQVFAWISLEECVGNGNSKPDCEAWIERDGLDKTAPTDDAIESSNIKVEAGTVRNTEEDEVERGKVIHNFSSKKVKHRRNSIYITK